MTPAYLVTGAELLVDEALERIRAEAGADPLAEASFDATTAPAELLTALETPSLLGGRRLVVVRNADDLSKDAVDALSRYLEAPSDAAVLVLVGRGRTKLHAAVKAAGAVIALEAPRGRALAGWVRTRAREHRLTIDDRGAWALVDAVGTELRDLDGALRQLATASGRDARVSAAEVRRAFPRVADERVFAFTDGVGDRRLSDAMTALRRLLDQGDEPLALFGALVAHVRRLLRVRRDADRGPRAVGDALGLPAWRAERLARQSRTYAEDELVAAMALLADTDVEMKGGDLPPEAALERAVVEIVTGHLGGRSPGTR
ncbi:MAG TPA: DNA polymerase III subunit delta [Actinomycetota bacterium]|nr:DNA polymerase III subunit delta [Actinomycetota bacterium]